VDNLTHTLCGFALARAGGDRLGPGATATLVVAANFPDCDVVGIPLGFGPAWFLCHHRGLTHSVLGLTVEAVLLGVVAALIARAAGLSASTAASAPRLIGAAALGLASHLALDSLNTYGVRPWLPFDGTWYYGDVAFIVDPWMWLGFGAAIVLGVQPPPATPPDEPEGKAEAALAAGERLAASGQGEAARDAALDALEALKDPGRLARREGRWRAQLASAVVRWNHVGLVAAGAAIIVAQRAAPKVVALPWTALAALVVVARERGWTSARPRTAALSALGAVALYLVVLGALGRMAVGQAHTVVEGARELHDGVRDGPVVDASCAPAPAFPWRFVAIVGDARRLHRVEVDLRAGTAVRTAMMERHLADPAEEERRLALAETVDPDAVRAWKLFARQPFVARDPENKGLLLGDGRFGLVARRSWVNLFVPQD